MAEETYRYSLFTRAIANAGTKRAGIGKRQR